MVINRAIARGNSEVAAKNASEGNASQTASSQRTASPQSSPNGHATVETVNACERSSFSYVPSPSKAKVIVITAAAAVGRVERAAGASTDEELAELFAAPDFYSRVQQEVASTPLNPIAEEDQYWVAVETISLAAPYSSSIVEHPLFGNWPVELLKRDVPELNKLVKTHTLAPSGRQ